MKGVPGGWDVIDAGKKCGELGGKLYDGICLKSQKLDANADTIPFKCNPYQVPVPLLISSLVFLSDIVYLGARACVGGQRCILLCPHLAICSRIPLCNERQCFGEALVDRYVVSIHAKSSVLVSWGV
jgi:hypothetical protein